MDFTFTEDQLLFQKSVHSLLTNEVTPEAIRERWKTATGRSDVLWSQLVEMGLTGITVPEEFGGMGMSQLDFVLLAQSAGYVALPEPLVHVAFIAVPALLALDNADLNAQWLPKIADGSAKIVVGVEENRFVEDAHIADLLLLQKGDEWHAVPKSAATLRHNESIDLSRKLFVVEFTPSSVTLVAKGEKAKALESVVINHGALAAAAQALGVAQRMIDLSVKYSSERQQFGKPIGSFQAVKHHMANIAYKLEYAKAPVYRAAYALANNQPRVDLYTSHAKIVSTEVAELAAKNSIQVHGAMGYTWEVDLHIFMKRAWALNNTWGDAAFHKNRVADYVLADDAKLGAGNTY